MTVRCRRPLTVRPLLKASAVSRALPCRRYSVDHVRISRACHRRDAGALRWVAGCGNQPHRPGGGRRSTGSPAIHSAGRTAWPSARAAPATPRPAHAAKTSKPPSISPCAPSARPTPDSCPNHRLRGSHRGGEWGVPARNAGFARLVPLSGAAGRRRRQCGCELARGLQRREVTGAVEMA